MSGCRARQCVGWIKLTKGRCLSLFLFRASCGLVSVPHVHVAIQPHTVCLIGPALPRKEHLPSPSDMRLSAIVFMLYCMFRGIALLAQPDRMKGVFPDLTISPGTDVDKVYQSSARAIGTLLVACGLLSLGGLRGRFASLLVAIFPMFYVNHVMDGVAHPPIVPVVATNVVVLVLNLVEAAGMGGSIGKYAYAAMQGGFGLLFLTEKPDLVQDPFTFAAEGTDALRVGQKLGFVVGAILIMHALMTLLPAPTGPFASMAVVGGIMAKLTFVDGVTLPAVSFGAAAVCAVLVLYDVVAGGGAKGKKD